MVRDSPGAGVNGQRGGRCVRRRGARPQRFALQEQVRHDRGHHQHGAEEEHLLKTVQQRGLHAEHERLHHRQPAGRLHEDRGELGARLREQDRDSSGTASPPPASPAAPGAGIHRDTASASPIRTPPRQPCCRSSERRWWTRSRCPCARAAPHSGRRSCRPAAAIPCPSPATTIAHTT